MERDEDHTPCTVEEAKARGLMGLIDGFCYGMRRFNCEDSHTVNEALINFIPLTPLAPALDGEPIFVLRAQDRNAPYVLMVWASESEAQGAPAEKVGGARTIAAEMVAWQQANPTRVKTAD